MLLDEIEHIEQSRSRYRSFGFSVGMFLVFVGIALWWFDQPYALYISGTGGGFILLGLALPGVLKPVYLSWMTLAVLLGWVMTRLLLGLIYYLILTPIALLSSMTGNQFLQKMPETSVNSYWNERTEYEDDNKRYTKQY